MCGVQWMRRRAFAWLVVPIVGSFVPLISSAQSPDEKRRAIEEVQRSPATARRLLRDRQAAEFTPSNFDGLPNELKGTVGILEHLMPKQALPHKTVRPLEVKDGLDLRVRVFAARDSSEDDLVEYRWAYRDRALRVLVGRNAVSMGFALDQLPACQGGHRGAPCVAAVRSWVEETLRLEGKYSGPNMEIEYKVDLPWPPELRDGVWFSSAPEQNLMSLRGMPFWHDRVDAFVDGGILNILIFRKVGQLQHYQDGSKWFPDDFRKLIRERQDAAERK